MSWQDDLQRVTMPDGRRLIGASFRGVPFFVETVEESGGRRVVIHEFPLRDAPFTEDMGASAKGYRVDAYVIGDDYLAQKQKLLDAVSAAGPGQFLHPEKGVLVALCKSYSTRYTRVEGRFSALALEFVDAPTQLPAPTAIADGAGQVDSSADAAVAATNAELVEKFSTSGLPSFSIASSELALNNALQGLQDKLAPAVQTTQELAQLAGNVATMTAEASSLVRQPALAIDDFRSVITDLVATAAATPGAVMDALFDAYAVDLGPVIAPTTSTRQREADNQAALTGALRRVIAIEAARLAPLATFTTLDDALAARDRVAGMLEEQAEGAGDTAYPALVDLRSQVLRAVPGAQEFARVVTVTRKVPVPALVLTYQLYGSVEIEGDVVTRNPSAKHPGFMVGDLKVLSDG